MRGAESAPVRAPPASQHGNAHRLACAEGHIHNVLMRLGKRVQVLNRGAKSSMEEHVALASRNRAGDRRFKVQALFAPRPTVWDRGQERAKGGLAFPQRHCVHFQMLLEDVPGMEGRMLATPNAVDVGKRRPDPSRDCNAVFVVSKGME